MNEIYLRRRSLLHVRPGTDGVTPQQMATMLKELEPPGYVLADEVVSRLSTMTAEDAARFLLDATQKTRKLVGAHRPHVPLHPGFTAQVVTLTEAQPCLNAVSHYVVIRPHCGEAQRFEGIEHEQVETSFRLKCATGR